MHRGWSSSNTTGSSHFLQVTPLTDGSPGPAGASAGTTVWQYQQQQQQQQDHHQQQQAALSTASRGSSPAGYLAPQASAFSAYGLNRPGSTGGSKAGSGKGAALHNGMNLMQHAQQRQRGLSGHGDEAARLLDQNRAQQGFVSSPASQNPDAQGAALMVSLEGWAAAPTRPRSTSADVAMVGRASHQTVAACQADIMNHDVSLSA